MKVLQKEKNRNLTRSIATYDPSLDNLPIPEIALKKIEEARETLRKYPIPEHLFRKK